MDTQVPGISTVGETVSAGFPPTLAITERTHCEACGGAVHAGVVHRCYSIDVQPVSEMTAEQRAVGYSPEVTVTAPADSALAHRLTEREKYECMWSHDEYRVVAPGEQIAALFLEVARPKAGSEVIDFGAGTGRGALMLAVLGGLKVRMLDFAENCLDADVRAMLDTQAHVLSFERHDLNDGIEGIAQFGYCTDVCEHLPPGNVDRVLSNILRAAQFVFFQIATEDDVCGALIGESLHLSVHDHAWWHAKLEELGATVKWSQEREGSALFYVTAWATGQDVVDVGQINIEESTMRANVEANLARGWQQATPHLANDAELMILGGGPSIDGQIDEIRRLRANGVGTVTLNGAYNWAIANGIVPGAQIVCDARAFNSRFTRPVIDECKYLIASQCDPSVLDGLPPERTYLWHTSAENIRDILDAKVPQWFGIPGGCTVLLRAIPLLRMLGFRRFHLFGCDSCVADSGRHHAYAQPENDGQPVISVLVGDRKFGCHAWQIAQAQDFIGLIKHMGDEFEIHVHGDGLLSWIIQHGSDVELERSQESESGDQSNPSD